MNTWIWLYMITMFIPIGILLIFGPYFTRKTVSFGVSISEEIYYSPIVRGLRKQYAILTAVILAVLLAGSITLLVGNRDAIEMVFPISIIAMIVLSILQYLYFHNRMKKLKAAHNWNAQQLSRVAIDLTTRKKSVISNWWYLLYVAIIAGCFFFTLSNYDIIPNQIAMKFDFNGNVTKMSDKSYGVVFMPQIIQLFMLALFIIINYTIRASKQIIDVSKPEVSKKQNLAFRRRSSVLMFISGLSMTLLFGPIQWNFVYPMDVQMMNYIIHFFVMITIFGCLWLAISTGQGGSRIAALDDQTGSGQYFKNDDAYWKLGVVYINSNDPAIIVEKRVGIGWTLNMGNPISWISLLGLLALIAGVAIYAAVVGA
ncbi:DUF5808 domain-containing protein [Paenibacillus sp. N1-5-1-14]|uniref:DUF1648 domain-containing protein n=1 Tax=Paenibacillus radicibacter TaxID=2972488 RepID=UPI002158C318|nr:DUF5808 domain-containing protein [Paenibacillus radicibacter]MCR8643104.1 DUF5808 domain-containing protein [Paenibacillus radicibacter]